MVPKRWDPLPAGGTGCPRFAFFFASQVKRVGSVTLEACPLGEVELPKDIEVVMTSAAWFSRGVARCLSWQMSN